MTPDMIEERVRDLIGRMTVEEKAAQTCLMRGVEYATRPHPVHYCSVEEGSAFDEARLAADFGTDGVGFVHDMYATPAEFNRIQRYFVEHTRLGIPAIFTAEALHGVNGTRGTIFPAPINWGATFDPELVRQVGAAIGRETRMLGMHEILAPNLDVARDPRWGRVEETFGEDTYLSCRMAQAVVSGEQKGDVSRPDAVVAEPKHFCVYGIPEGGTNCAPARAGRREIESCYLPVFETAICDAGAYNVMVSYNSVDGDAMMASPYYLRDVLKERLGLRGYARSDWGGVGRLRTMHHLVSTDRDAIAMAINNGLDVQGSDFSPLFWKQTVVELVREGRIPMARLDDICARVLRVKFALGLFEHPYTDESGWREAVRCPAHREVALHAARESVTLLKNGGALPLSREIRSLALIGPCSAAQRLGGYSSLPQFHVNTLHEELEAMLGDRVTIRQHDGCAITEGEKRAWSIPGQPHLASQGEEQIHTDIDAAVAMAAECDVIVAVCGDNALTCGEGKDRCGLTLFGRQRELVERLAQTGRPVVLVLESGRPVELSRESEICDAILLAWYGGECGARAIAQVLTGAYSPAGRLPVSLPRDSGSIPCYYSMLPGSYDSYVDSHKGPLYPFGFGLSYTSFAYCDLTVVKNGGHSVTVTCTVENTGAVDGDEVVQLYIDDVDSTVVTPPCLLRGFERIFLRAGEKRTVTFPLDEQSFRLMDQRYEWRVEPGVFRILVGAAVNDIRLEGTVSFAE